MKRNFFSDIFSTTEAESKKKIQDLKLKIVFHEPTTVWEFLLSLGKVVKH